MDFRIHNQEVLWRLAPGLNMQRRKEMSQVPAINQAQQAKVWASAWGTLLIFFLLFCSLIAAGGFFGLRYYTTAMVPVTNTLLLKYVPTGVLMKQPDLAVAQDVMPAAQRPTGCTALDPAVCVPFTEGQRLLGRHGAGFGHVAALKLPDQTLINLHTQPDGFDITLDHYLVSRWTKESQEVELTQAAGYARYDIAKGQQYKHVRYTVTLTNGVSVDLGPGSYSINVPRDEGGQPRGRLITDPPILAEIAVRSGTLTIHSDSEPEALSPRPGELVQIALDGTFITPEGSETAYQRAAWELIPDGDFNHFTTAQYNTPGQTTSWNIRSYDPSEDKKRTPGEFSIIHTCPRELKSCKSAEYIPYGLFEREVGDDKPYTTGIDNLIDADVSEFTKSLAFHADVSILKQSIDNAGERGSECPIMVEIRYKLGSPAENDQSYFVCAFVLKRDNPIYVQDPNITYYPINWFAIYPIDFDLRKLSEAPNSPRYARYISSVRIQAAGHDYQSQVTRVSLVGK